MEIWEEDVELREKLVAVKRQHEIDLILNMPPLDFANGLLDFYKKDYYRRTEIDPKRNPHPEDPIVQRWKYIDDRIYKALING